MGKPARPVRDFSGAADQYIALERAKAATTKTKKAEDLAKAKAAAEAMAAAEAEAAKAALELAEETACIAKSASKGATLREPLGQVKHKAPD
ncbi:hypothetical protein ONS95_012800 [Cadophora gregata]|uniref:uncharacterized protein n=1 Tax=Cadophora gregata TaxID=51156 RepID=UPI0026DA816F|nr:uncharacterized protein ONS95_012800 [Cadophora gregata]KAK0115747.1 hypothetical protein ONS95_012800 [Cadophora gregata]